MFKKVKQRFAALASILIIAASLAPVTVSAASSPNLIPNPSFETAQDAQTPQGWSGSSWKTPATFTYLSTGHTGSRSVEVTVTNYTSGDANWYYTDLPVTAGESYAYENWYKSDVATEVDAEVVMSDNTMQYFNLGSVAPSTSWAKFSTDFSVPIGAKAMSIYQLIAQNGYLITDDYSLSAYTPDPFSRAIVSVSFDDGWVNQLENAEPVLLQYHIPATYNIISGEMINPDEAGYMTSQQVLGLYQDGNSNEIASHTVHHCDLTGAQTDNPQNCPIPISVQQVHDEMFSSKTTLENLIGAPITDFAYPYGAYNDSTIAVGEQAGYLSQRTVNAGYNTKDNLDPTRLKIYEVDSDITAAQVQAWVDGAIAAKAWLILVYHEVATTPSDPSDSTYTTLPADFATEMAYIHGTGVKTETVANALAETTAQVGQTTPPPVISNVSSSAITTSGAAITWATDEDSTSQVNYGATASYGSSSTLDSATVTNHSVTLTGLQPNTIYHYQVVSTNASGGSTTSGDSTFTTAPTIVPGDVNGDGVVNILDLSTVLTNWNKTGATRSQGDVTGDGIVNVFDLSAILTDWSK